MVKGNQKPGPATIQAAPEQVVTPAKAGVQVLRFNWIPACTRKG